MRHPETYLQKILNKEQARQQVMCWRMLGQSVVFTNGVFDLLHEGHLFSLCQAAKEGTRLVVAINSDSSVKRLKGPERPIQSQTTRSQIIAALVFVDAVIVFEDDTPAELIEWIEPDVLVKGGDYKPEQIAGAESVLRRGGKVIINPILDGHSTTHTISRLKKS